MAKGGSNTPAQTVVNQNAIAPELLPYATSILNSGQQLGNQPYEAYPGQRLANQSPMTQEAYAQTPQLASDYQPYLNQAAGAYGTLQSTQQALSGESPWQTNGVANVNAGQISGVPNVSSSAWTDPGTAQAYMNPYEQTALQSQFGLANQQFGQQQNQRDSAAIQAGAFGGDRAGLVNEAAQRDFNNSLFNIAAQGMNTAYNTGQTAFQGDRSANLLAQEANQQSNLSAQGSNLQAMMAAQQSNQNAALQSQNLNANQYDFLQNLKLQAANDVAGTGAGLANLGSEAQGLQSNAINAEYNAGQSQQAYQQQGLDIGYNDFLNQQQYPYNQLNFQSALLHGFNVPAQNTQTTYTPTNPVSQITGAGLGLAGLSNLLKSGAG